MELEEIKIYRMTHIKNIPHILKYGITHKNSLNANPDFLSIGDLSLIDFRDKKVVSVNNGDLFNLNAPKIILGNFIPFYFGIKMPMLFVMQNGGNFVEKATPASDIVYLASSLIDIINSDLKFYFTDVHAVDEFVEVFDSSRVPNLPTLIDWKSVKAPYWGGQDNLDVKRKKQAEFLLLDDLPPELIFGFGCYNDNAKAKLISMGVEEEKIKIIPNAYY